MKVPFNKTPSTRSQLLGKLKSKNLNISKRQEKNILSQLDSISYYRYKAYWATLLDVASQNFLSGTSFEDLKNLYDFDRKLRNIVLYLIEDVEIIFRNKFIDIGALKEVNDAHYFLNDEYFEPKCHKKNISHLDIEISRQKGKEDFLDYYCKKYYRPEQPPVWAIAEMMSIGSLSKWIGSLQLKYKKAMAKDLQLPNFSMVESFLLQITNVRNRCAHHGRLWNKVIHGTLTLPFNDPVRFPLSKAFNYSFSKQSPNIVSSRIWNIFALSIHIVGNQCPHKKKHLLQTIRSLKSLIKKHSINPINDMGFIIDWEMTLIKLATREQL